MSKQGQQPLINNDGEVRELQVKDFAQFKPASEVLPDELYKKLRGQRGPQKAPTKVQVTLRLSPEVEAYFRSSGKGWQSRIDDVLKTYVSQH